MKNILSSVIIGVSILGGFVLTGIMNSNDKLISEVRVEGRAEAKIQADLFEWNFSQETVGSSAEEVKETAKKAKREIIAIFAENGLERDVDFVIKPKQLKAKKTDEGKDVFIITQEYEVKTQRMEEAQACYQKSEHFVDQSISIISQNTDVYKVKDKTELEKKLLQEALGDSKNKAERIAELAGGVIISLPNTSWSSIRIKDSNSSDEVWNSGSSIEQTAIVEISATYKIRNK